MSEREQEQGREEQAEETVGDLDVRDGEDVTGGSLNTYVSKVQGEKQGGYKGGG